MPRRSTLAIALGAFAQETNVLCPMLIGGLLFRCRGLPCKAADDGIRLPPSIGREGL